MKKLKGGVTPSPSVQFFVRAEPMNMRPYGSRVERTFYKKRTGVKKKHKRRMVAASRKGNRNR